MFNFFNKTDQQITADVELELKWDPSIVSAHIQVKTNDGIVSLSGTVPHYIERSKAELAAQRVGGVRAVVDEIEVDLDSSFKKTDEAIARAALSALEWNYNVPSGIHVSVSKGWVTLTGEVQWDFQRAAARYAVSSLYGVAGMTNSISIMPALNPSDIKQDILTALRRSAENEGREISVEVEGDKVFLKGKVHSFGEMDDAGQVAWKAAGVKRVENDLVISP